MPLRRQKSSPKRGLGALMRLSRDRYPVLRLDDQSASGRHGDTSEAFPFFDKELGWISRGRPTRRDAFRQRLFD